MRFDRGRRAATISLLSAIALTAALAPPALAGVAPLNDRFQDAISIGSGSLPATRFANTDEATEQGGTPEGVCSEEMGNDVWYRITPNRDMILRADTIGSDNGADIEVWKGTHLQSIAEVACNDAIDTEGGSTNFEARVTFRAKQGVPYVFQVGGDPGNLVFNLREVDPPSNDSFGDARWINHYPFVTSVNTRSATTQGFERVGQCFDLMATVWYRTQPASRMVLRASTFGTGFDTMLAVFEGGPSKAELDRIACVDDTDPGGIDRESSLAWRAKEGVIYYIVVGGFDGSNGDIDLEVKHVTPVGNDQFNNAMVASGPVFDHDTNTRNATIQENEPLQDCGLAQNGSVWYRYTAPDDTGLFLTGDSDGDFSIGLYQGSSLSNLSGETDNCNNHIETSVSAGQTFYIQVTSFDDDAGPVSFHLEEFDI